MQEIDFYLPHLPLANNRMPIFEELKKIFKAKRWIAYYSLALTQIEGLFSEMYDVLNPVKGFNRKSLPEKVAYARPFHDMSSFYFDYYQYHIPVLRNRFMHFGFDEDFQLKSFDLLFDLRYLLKIFYELNNPLVKITQLHTKRNPDNFITYSDFASYFELINDLDAKQRSKLSAKIKSFEKDFLQESCNVEYVCLEVAQDLPKHLSDFSGDIQRRLKDKGKTIDLSGRDFNALKNMILKDAEVLEIFSDYFNFQNRKFGQLSAYYQFLYNFKKHLPSLNKDHVKILEELIKDVGSTLKNIVQLKDTIKVDIE